MPSVHSAVKRSIFQTWVKQLYAVIKMGQSTSIRLSNTLRSSMDDFIQRPERSEPVTTNSEANSNAMNKETIGAFCTGNCTGVSSFGSTVDPEGCQISLLILFLQ